jgi:undecaprenyl-diphosphatase
MNETPGVKINALFFSLLTLAIVDAILSRTSLIIPFNMDVFSAVYSMRVGLPWLTGIMTTLTRIGSDPVLFVVVIVLAVWAASKSHWSDSARLLIVASAARILVFVLKNLVKSPRPHLIAPPPPLHMARGYGFPSGHSLMSIAILGSVAAVLARHSDVPAVKVVVTLCSVVLILGVGISRVYVGVHWANDVVGGYLFGGSLLVLSRLYWKD